MTIEDLEKAVALLALAFSLALTPALAAGSVAPVTAIYQRVVASYDGKQNNTENGYFIMKSDKARRRYLSARTAKLWREADRLTPKGDVDPLDLIRSPIRRTRWCALRYVDQR